MKRGPKHHKLFHVTVSRPARFRTVIAVYAPNEKAAELDALKAAQANWWAFAWEPPTVQGAERGVSVDDIDEITPDNPSLTETEAQELKDE